MSPAQEVQVMTVEDLKGKLSGRRVLVRTDFNVSDAKTGKIKSELRISAALPTLEFLVQEKAIVFVISHNERPSEQVRKLLNDKTAEDEAWRIVRQRLSLGTAVARLEEILVSRQAVAPGGVHFVAATTGRAVAEAGDALKPGEILVLENTRFDPRDEAGDPSLAAEIVAVTRAELFVLDGFSVAHRDQASVTKAAAKVSSGTAVAGFLVSDELKYLQRNLLQSPLHPYYAFMGGAKVGGKIQVIKNLLSRLDALFVGGAMLYPFLIADERRAGADPLDRPATELEEDVKCAKRILKQGGKKVVLPTAVIVELGSGGSAKRDAADAQGIPDDARIRDVAAEPLEGLVRKTFRERGNPKTIVWNGPFGMFEKESFDAGTLQLLKLLDHWTAEGCLTVTGGGDSEKAIKHAAKKLGTTIQLSHVSTGGGAMLELLEGKVLPGIAALSVRRQTSLQ